MACTCAILSTQHTSSLFTAAQEKEGGPGKAQNTYACYAWSSLFSHLVACLSYWQWTVVSSISIELDGVEISIHRASPLLFVVTWDGSAERTQVLFASEDRGQAVPTKSRLVASGLAGSLASKILFYITVHP
jgi:hypothetical protein